MHKWTYIYLGKLKKAEPLGQVVQDLIKLTRISENFDFSFVTLQ